MPRLPTHTVAALTAVLTAVSAVVAEVEDTYKEPSGVRSRASDRERGQQWLRDCLADPEQLFVESRLRRETFLELAEYLRTNQYVTDGKLISLEEKLLTFLYVCGQGASWRNTRYRCGHSKSTITATFHEVLKGMLHLYRDYVKSPAETTPPAILNDPRRYPFFEDCVGALDGSHFVLHVPEHLKKRYRNRHGYISHNVLAVVDFDLNFLYILPGWEGSAHDGRVLKSAIDKGFSAPPGKYYLGDAGYTNSSMLLTPYRGTRYHLREIQALELRPTNREELFNYRHSSLRNAVERVFGIFKRRWRIFDRPHEFSVATQTKLVFALAGIHNFINQRYSVDRDFEALGSYEGEDREQKFREKENRENLNSDSSEMSTFRDELAQRMWDQYVQAQQVVSA